MKEQEAKYAQYYKTNSKYDQASMADSQYAGTGYKAAEGSSYQNANYYSSNGDNQQEDGDNSYQQANQYQSSQSGNGGNRKLAVDMSGYKLLNCSKCDEMLCGVNVYDDQQQNQGGDQQQEVDDAWVPQIDMESVAQWMDVMTECQQTSATLFDAGLYPLYSGFMCNADGTGIEIALFLDEECLTYTSLQSFNKVASAQYDLPYMDYVKQVLQFPIENDISCKADTVYVNNDLYTAISNGQTAYTNYAENGEEQEQDEDKQSESSEFCRDLFEGGEDGEAVSIKNCPEEDGDQQQENQAYDENGDVITMYSDYTYDWYTYVVTQENARESRNVCPIVAAMHGEYTYIYEEGGSGSLYKETTATASGGSSSSIVTHYAQMASEKLTPMIIAIISAVVLLATAAFCCILYSCCCKSSIPNQFTEQTEGVRQRRHGSVTNDGGESKRERLVDATTGKLA